MRPLPTLLAMPLILAAPLWAAAPATKPAHGEKPAATYPEGVSPPIITDKFSADPHAIVIGDTYYVYPTVDKENWQTTEFMVWSSKDLIHWKDNGIILNLAGGDVSWAHIRAWAPGVVAKDGKVYFYFCGEQSIGVAVADSPTGPFKDPLDKPLVPKGMFRGQMIDPCPFIDDDAGGGQAYLYWGNGGLYAAKLGKDMISLEGGKDGVKTITPQLPGPDPTPELRRERFNEGVFVFKRKGTYYFSWSENDARSPDYRVAYGTSKSPFGPIEPAAPADRIILKKSGDVIGTGHHSIINVPGTDDWYIIYHRHAVPGGNGFIRETCLSKLEFTEDGRIKPVDVTHPAFPEGSAGQPVPKAVAK